MSSDAALPEQAPVVIAGAGPTGLTLALALQSWGIQALICEAAPQPQRESSRATTVHAGSLELLDRFGLADQLIGRGFQTKRSRVFRGTQPLVEQDWTRLPSRYPFLLNLAQAEVEATLREKLAALGGGVRFGCEVIGHQQQEEHVDVELSADGAEHSVRCAVLVGCDGAHSAVRRTLGLSLEGETYPDVFALADAVVRIDIDPQCSIFGGSDDGLMGLLAMPGGRYRINATIAEKDAEKTVDFEKLARERLPTHEVKIDEIIYTSTYAVHRRATKSMYRRRVVLAGDAAHLNSPIGGQGMNRGIRDAFDLGWRLKRLVEGTAGARILADWEVLRMEDAARVLEGTDRLTRMLRASGMRAAIVGRVLPVASRVLRLSDRVSAEMAGLEDARNIIARSERG